MYNNSEIEHNVKTHAIITTFLLVIDLKPEMTFAKIFQSVRSALKTTNVNADKTPPANHIPRQTNPIKKKIMYKQP